MREEICCPFSARERVTADFELLIPPGTFDVGFLFVFIAFLLGGTALLMLRHVLSEAERVPPDGGLVAAAPKASSSRRTCCAAASGSS